MTHSFIPYLTNNMLQTLRTMFTGHEGTATLTKTACTSRQRLPSQHRTFIGCKPHRLQATCLTPELEILWAAPWELPRKDSPRGFTASGGASLGTCMVWHDADLSSRDLLYDFKKALPMLKYSTTSPFRAGIWVCHRCRAACRTANPSSSENHFNKALLLV